MSREHNLVTDIHGVSRLVIEGTAGVTGLVESMHATIAGLAGIVPGTRTDRTRGITGLVYRCIGGTTWLVGSGIDLAMAPLAKLGGSRPASPARETAIGILNGVLGDHLAAGGNPLAIPMTLRSAGAPVPTDPGGLRAMLPEAGDRILVQLHGLCMNDLHWRRDGEDPVAGLARSVGYTPLQLHYNTGLSIAENGRQFGVLLEELLGRWPVTPREVALVGHSMGGLVARSAAAQSATAGHRWPALLGKMIFLGTPHHGAPLERAGHLLDRLLGLTPYTLPFTRLGRVRSAGITDLRHGSLLDEDWAGLDRYAAKGPRARTPVPLPAGADCYAIAALSSGEESGKAAGLIGDGLVPLDSALGDHEDDAFALGIPDPARRVVRGIGHLELLWNPQVLASLRGWLSSAS